MAHVVTSKCQGCKFTDCVEVCPVACFYELEDRLIINPDDCIDCAARVSECPVEAIYADPDVPSQHQPDIEFNAIQAKRVKETGLGAIVQKMEPLTLPRRRKRNLVTDDSSRRHPIPSQLGNLCSLTDVSVGE